jgi:hypothetical protein
MWNFILELLKTLGTTAIVVGASAWLTKSLITHFLSRKIEAYKIELKSESDKGIEDAADGAIACFSSNLFAQARMLIARRS